MKGILTLLSLTGLVAGCALSKDGVGFAAKPASADQVAKTHAQLEQNAAGEPPAAQAQPGILIVGTTGPLRTLDDKERAEFYRAYVRFAGEWHPGEPPALDDAAFQAKLGGWASIQTFAVPLIMTRRARVLVPATLVQDTRFASTAGSFIYGASGDLVAAKGDRDGLVWIDRVLCKSGHAFQACADKYQEGVFDENTGRELTGDRKPKPDGEWIDVSSYLRLSKDPERHKASELDPRAINRCDDCKGAVPGSPQSNVPVPQLDNR
jgi:hypothetical protein